MADWFRDYIIFNFQLIHRDIMVFELEYICQRFIPIFWELFTELKVTVQLLHLKRFFCIQYPYIMFNC